MAQSGVNVGAGHDWVDDVLGAGFFAHTVQGMGVVELGARLTGVRRELCFGGGVGGRGLGTVFNKGVAVVVPWWEG